jgi:plasmid stability protein
MKNITLAIDEEVLRSARIYAAEHDTTVNALVREFLAQFDKQREVRAAKAREELVKMSEESTARMGSWKWNRDDAYEGRVPPRHQHSDLRGFGERDGTEKEDKGD